MATNLTQRFTHEDNCDYIINTVFENIRKKLKINLKYDEIFFNAFNTISSSVFKAECSKNNLDHINHIVINELLKYIFKNIIKFNIEDITQTDIVKRTNEFFLERKHQDNLQDNPPDNPQRDNPQQYNQPDNLQQSNLPDNLQQLRQNFKTESVVDLGHNKIDIKKTIIHLEEYSSTILIDKIIDIKLLSIDIPNCDYIITESCNEFIFVENFSDNGKELYSEPYHIKIIPGNYTSEQLMLSLEDSINSVSSNNYNCRTNIINNKTCILNNDGNFDIMDCSLLSTLGFNGTTILKSQNQYISDNPIKLVKKRFITLTIYINESDIIFKERVYLDHKNDTYTHKVLNLQHKFNKSVYINDIIIDLDGYNCRNYDYSVELELSQYVI